MECKILNTSELFLGLLVLVFVSCGKQANKQTDSKKDVFQLTDTVHVVTENLKITAFKAYVAKLDSSDVTSATKAAEEFKTTFKGQSPTLCDSGFVVFQLLYDSIELHLNATHQNDTTNYEPLLYGDQASIPKKLKEFRKKLVLNGFKISASEGTTYIEQDRNFIAQNFYEFVTPAMKEYLNEIQRENKEGFAISGTITISPRQLVDRTVWYEKFIAAHLGFAFESNCKNYQKAYLTYLLCGYQNTSIYQSKESNEISDFYINAYTYLFSKYSDSQAVKTITPYYDALKQKQAATAQSILKNYRIKGLIYSLK